MRDLQSDAANWRLERNRTGGQSYLLSIVHQSREYYGPTDDPTLRGQLARTQQETTHERRPARQQEASTQQVVRGPNSSYGYQHSQHRHQNSVTLPNRPREGSHQRPATSAGQPAATLLSTRSSSYHTKTGEKDEGIEHNQSSEDSDEGSDDNLNASGRHFVRDGISKPRRAAQFLPIQCSNSPLGYFQTDAHQREYPYTGSYS